MRELKRVIEEHQKCPCCNSGDIAAGSVIASLEEEIFIKCKSCNFKVQINKEYGWEELLKRWNAQKSMQNTVSKSILIMDTPSSCEDCKACVNVLGKHYCVAKGTHIANGERDCSCPLVAVQEEINLGKVCEEYQQGWNDCLKEILGGSSE